MGENVAAAGEVVGDASKTSEANISYASLLSKVNHTGEEEHVADAVEHEEESGHRGTVGGEPRAKSCSIEARTQSGETYSFPDVAWNSTVFDLKGLIYVKHQKFEIDEIRLLRNGKALDDDEATIESLGFKNKDTVFMIRRLHANSSSTAVESSSASSSKPASTTSAPAPASSAFSTPPTPVVPPATEQTYLTVQCPPGCAPGSRVTVAPPGRPPMTVIIPAGVGPGGLFRVPLQPLLQVAPKIVNVRCPPGVYGGQAMFVDVPGTGRVKVVVPYGVFPGQEFRFQVPG